MRHIEIDGALNHPFCLKRGSEPPRGQAVHISNCRPYADDTAKAQAYIAYYLANGITTPMIRVDMGQTFGGVSSPANCPLYAQPTVADLVHGYATGCLDYRDRVGSGPWAGCEFDRFCTIAKMYHEAELRPVLLFDLLGEHTADFWACDPATREGRAMRQVLDGLTANPLALARGFPRTLRTPMEDWGEVYQYCRAVMNTTCARIVEDSPLRGCRFMVAGSCGTEGCIREDGLLQPECQLTPSQISHLGYYGGRGSHEAVTAACANAAGKHSQEFDLYAVNLSLEDPPQTVALRDRFGRGTHTILWGNDLDKLDAVSPYLVD